VITPLAQRQIFQTANIESVRAAHEVSEQIQREQVRKKVAEDHAAEEQASVQVISGSDKIRAEERRGNRGGAEHHPGGGEEGEEKTPQDKADTADPHLDFLA